MPSCTEQKLISSPSGIARASPGEDGELRPTKRHAPIFVLSLDFELRWGVHDVYGLDVNGYRANLEQERHAAPALLKMLAAYGTRATWATVGAIACQSWDEYFARAPAPPRYARQALAVKPEYAQMDPQGALHFWPELVRSIVDTPGQELGTHTFSHLYLREEGITADDVAADLAAGRTLFEERFGVKPESMVFPRNQAAFIETVRAAGIKVWRGNPGPWYYEREDSEGKGPLPRALKLLDGLNPLRRMSFPMQSDMTRASMFLRLNLPQPLWQLHFLRIRRELASLRPGQIFHLWFHPHNLGADTSERLARVEQVLEATVAQRSLTGLESKTMRELVD